MPKIIGFLYRKALKPALFAFDAEKVHDFFLRVGKWLGRHKITRAIVRWAFSYRNPALEQTVLGIRFANPVGLAAGFDKDAELTDIIPDVGFGFEEVGSITGEPCDGNPKPRLWRLPKYESLVVNYGLKNAGAIAIAKRLEGGKFRIPIGVNIAKTNSVACADTEAGVADYAKAMEAMKGTGDYFTVNISCPNSFGGQPFSDPELLEKLLARLDRVEHGKPVFIKFSPDLTIDRIDSLVDVAIKHRVHGFIVANLTKYREGTGIAQGEFPGPGGLSGALVQNLSDQLIAHLHKRTAGKYVIIGLGGIFSAEDAFRKIRLGASLVQLVTGMIYHGPQLIGEINRGLAKLLKENGFKSIAEAVGSGGNGDLVKV